MMQSHVNGDAGEAASTKKPSRKRMRMEAAESSSSANPGVAFTVVLQQAIQSGDEERLGEIIRRGDIQPEVLQKTVEQMPVTNVVPFLELVARMVEDPALMDPRPWMNWIHAVLVTHASYLSSIVDLDKRIGRLAEWMEKRVTNLDKLLQLQGKLELVADQMATRSKPVLYATQEPATVFDTGDDGDEAGEDVMETGSQGDEDPQEEPDSDEGEDDEEEDEEDEDEDEEDGGEVDDSFY